MTDGKPSAKPSAEPPNLWIDSNENSKWKWDREARMYGFSPIVQPQEVGDFRFVAADCLWYVERKAAPSDLEASFTDGRLSTQFVRAQDKGVERLILLIEGEINKVILGPNIKGTLIEYQAGGVFLDFCEVGMVVPRLYELYHFLSKDDHAYLRRPVMPLPTKYTYFDRDRQRRVRALMAYDGVSETIAVEGLKRWTMGEILERPEVLMEIRGMTRASVLKMYEMMQREVPEGVAANTAKARRNRGTLKVDPVAEEIPLDVTWTADPSLPAVEIV